MIFLASAFIYSQKPGKINEGDEKMSFLILSGHRRVSRDTIMARYIGV